jgi:hypothetical protein
MSDYQKNVTIDRTTDNSRMHEAHEWIISVVCHEWHIFGNQTSKLVIMFII